jgi:FAD:protein FMN transferase
VSLSAYRQSIAAMGTIVTIDVAGPAQDQDAVDRALDWFARIEECCTRFRPQSELLRLTAQSGVAVPVSTLLFEALNFARTVAEETAGAFDPTVGAAMESRGFATDHRSGRTLQAHPVRDDAASYLDIVLDQERKTVTLRRPLVLDLGGVAKGLAIDMAARELAPLENFVIDAGGDLYLGGHNSGRPWSVGIRHPQLDNTLIETVRARDAAVCTSGQYERPGHILDPRDRNTAQQAASVTVIAPTAMLADALATAAFVLGPQEGIALFERSAVDGVIYTPSLERYATEGLRG